MYKFIKRTLLFFSIIIVILVFIEIAIRLIPNDYSYKNDFLGNNGLEIQILSIGSSHGLYAIDPAYFHYKGFNASHVSQSLNYDHIIWEKFKESLKNLNTLIIPISYFSLFSKLEDGIEAWRQKNYAIYYGTKADKIRYYFEIPNQTPFAIIRMLLKTLIGKTNLTISEYGASNKYSKQQDLVSSGLNAARRHTKDVFKRLNENVAFLSSILSYCEDNGIRVLLVTTPTTDYYWKNLDENQLQTMQSTISSMVSNYSNVRYFNFLKDERFEYSDFRDADHLNPTGAEKFSKLLDKIIISDF